MILKLPEKLEKLGITIPDHIKTKSQLDAFIRIINAGLEDQKTTIK